MNHPIESLLRPAVEINVSLSHLGCATIAAMGPHYLLMTPTVGQGTALVLSLSAALWFNRGWQILRYRRNLNRLSLYELAVIPAKPDTQFIGKGFVWSEVHTQRLHDTRRTRFQPFIKPGLQNPFSKRPPGGGSSYLHGVELKEKTVTMPLADRRGHTLVLGTTGVGKTRLLEVLVSQDIERGGPIIVFDPKGDADLLTVIHEMCEKHGREFVLFHLGYPEISARYNGVGSFSRITEVAGRIAGQLSGEGQSAVFKEFAWRFVNIVAKAVVALGQTPDYRTMLQHVNAIDELFIKYVDYYFADDEQILGQVADFKVLPDNQPRHMQGRPDKVIAWDAVLTLNGGGDEVVEALRMGYKYERSYFDKIVASLIPLLEKLTTGKTSELLSPDYNNLTDDRPVFDWNQIVNQQKVVYVGLDALSDATVASAVGNSMFADLVSFAGSRYKHGDTFGLHETSVAAQHPIPIYMDEFNELMGDEFIPMINKGGAAGLHITALTQTYSDIQAKIGVEAKAKQVRGNFNNLLMLRVQEKETAQLLTDQLPAVSVHDLTIVSGYNDSSDPESDVDFTSRHEDRITTSTVSMLEPHDVMKLPKGQAFAILRGGTLYKIRLPLAKVTRHTNYNKAFGDLTRDMRAKYRTGLNWWDTSE